MGKENMASTETKKIRNGIRTLYNPKVGCAYVLINTSTGERSQGSTLTIRDNDQKPWRSPKSTPQGEEFFKMKSGTKREGFSYYKFMNSIIHPKCLSEDGVWEFIGVRPNGQALTRVEYNPQDNENDKGDTVVSLNLVDKANTAQVAESNFSQQELREEIMDSEFSNASALEEIFGH